MIMDLDVKMEIDLAVRVHPDGSVTDAAGVYAPEVSMDTGDDGQILAGHEAAMVADLKRQGWDVESGWTGQQGYRGPVMHTSEFIGGRLAEHILATPGYWVACAVYVASEECPNGSPTCTLSDPCVICHDHTGKDREQDCAGWIIAHREA
jgi:hypothetical protein